MKKIQQLFKNLEDGEAKYKIGLASNMGTVLSFISDIPEVKELIQFGKESAQLLVHEFEKDTLNPVIYQFQSQRDLTLACVAYILLETKYQEAVPILIRFLKRNWNEETKYFWTLPLATATLKALTGQRLPPKDLSPLERRELIIQRAEEWLYKNTRKKATSR